MSELTILQMHADKTITVLKRSPFILSDGGRAKSKRPRQSNDCTVRALAHATGLPYDLVYDDLKEEGRACGKGFRFGNWVKELIWQEKTYRGFSFDWFPLQAVKGKPRIHIIDFPHIYQRGCFILKWARHVLCFDDGVIYDGFYPDPQKCVYGAWEVKKRHD